MRSLDNESALIGIAIALILLSVIFATLGAMLIQVVLILAIIFIILVFTIVIGVYVQMPYKIYGLLGCALAMVGFLIYFGSDLLKAVELELGVIL